MTISTTTNRNEYPGAGSTGPFAYSFRVFAATDLRVIRRTAAGVEAVLTYPTDYSVTGVGSATGTITLTTALATGETLVIRRVRPITQVTSIRNQGEFLPATHEDAFDHLVMVDQQQQNAIDRSLHLPESIAPNAAATELPTSASRASKLLGFDAQGNPTVYPNSPSAGIADADAVNYLRSAPAVSRFVGDKLRERFSVFDFMTTAQKSNVAAGLGTLDVTAALTAAFTEVASLVQLKAADAINIARYTGPKVVFPYGRYSYSSQLAYNAGLFDIEGEGMPILVQTADAHHFEAGGAGSQYWYQTQISNLHFEGGRSVLKLDGFNLDVRALRLSNLSIATGNASYYAFDLYRVGLLEMDHMRVVNAPKFLTGYGDQCTIWGGWYNGWLRSSYLKPNDTDSIYNGWRKMQIYGGIFVPEPGVVAGPSVGTRWITNPGYYVEAHGCLFGGEGGGLPVVFYTVGGSSADTRVYPFYSSSGVKLEGCSLNCGLSSRPDRAAIVLKGSVPGKIVVRDCDGLVDQMVISDYGFSGVYGASLEQYLLDVSSAQSPKVGVQIENNNIYGIDYPAALARFVDIKNIAANGNQASSAKFGGGVSYLPSHLYDQSYHTRWTSGQKRAVVTGTPFNILNFTKVANTGTGSAGVTGILTVAVSGELTGPAQFQASKQYLVTLLAPRAGTVVGSVTQIQRAELQSGGAAIGDVITVAVKAGATAVAIQLECSISSGAATLSTTAATWTFDMLSVTDELATPRTFSVAAQA